MNQQRFIFVVLFLFLATASYAQSINVEKDRFPGTKQLEVKSFNGCCAQKGYRAIYVFDSIGRAIKSYNYFKRKLLAAYEYRYNERGLLSEKKSVFDINKNAQNDYSKFIYKFDTIGRLVNKTEQHGNWVYITLFTDFDYLNNAKTVIRILSENAFLDKNKFDSLGQLIHTKSWANDTLVYTEEIKYNAFGDIVYSYIPTLQDKETGKMIMMLGGNRHWYEEEYTYTYDKQNHWVEKYVVYNNKKVLIEKRVYVL